MLNKQLNDNIKDLDLQIGKLTKELESMKEDNRYELKRKTLEDFVDLRNKLMEYQDEKSEVIVEIDRQILDIAKELVDIELDNTYLSKMKQLDDLTKIRGQLTDSRTKESHAPTIISGLIGVSSILIVLKYEKTEIITSKAFNIAMKMFRGN